jgi:hypothetical protein
MAVKKVAVVYSITVGVLMIAMWLFFILTGNVPEFETIPYSISLHLFDEFVTAVLLIIGGVGLIKKAKWALHIHLISLGMLFYTVIVSPGYYLDQGQIYIPILFAVLLIFAIILSILTFIKRKGLVND